MLNECKRIYREAFLDDDNEFEELLFRHCGRYIKKLEINDNLVSMLFLLPCKASADGIEKNGFYIYAAATDKLARGKGYMSSLISGLKLNENEFLFLRPANKELVNFYKKLGFIEIDAIGNANADLQLLPTGGFKTLTEETAIKDSNPFLAMHKGLDGYKKIYFPYSME